LFGKPPNNPDSFKEETEEITEEWRKLHSEEFNDMHSSRNSFRVIKSRRMRWAGHVRAHLEDTGESGMIILGWIFRKWDGGYGLD
jgi:hypothetical protein